MEGVGPVGKSVFHAIHIGTASLIRERLQPQLVFVTHDQQQARAARALGFDCE
jgi:hypothetical protein